MDEELKLYLDGMTGEFRGNIAELRSNMADMETRFDAKLNDAFTRFSQHILHEAGTRFDEVNTRLESIDSRLKLQAGLIQGGARAMARFSEFAETSEQRWISLVGRVAALEQKFEKGGAS